MKNILKKISFLLLSFVYLQQNNAEIISATWLQNNQTGQNIFLYGDKHLVRPANAVQIEKITNSLLPNTKESSIIFVENYNPSTPTEEDKLKILWNLTKAKDNFTQIEFTENRRIILDELFISKQIINLSKKFILFMHNKNQEDLTLYNETENQAPLSPFLFFNEMAKIRNIDCDAQNLFFSNLIGVKKPFLPSDTNFYVHYLYPMTGGRILAHQEIQYLKNKLEMDEDQIKQTISDLINILSQTTNNNLSRIMNELNNKLYKPIYKEYSYLFDETEEHYEPYIISQLHAIKAQLYHLQVNPTIPSFKALIKETENIINNLEKKLDEKIKKKRNNKMYLHLYTILEKEKTDFSFSMRKLKKISNILKEDLIEESISYILREQFEMLLENKFSCLKKSDCEKKQTAILIISNIEKLAHQLYDQTLCLFDINTIIKILETEKQNVIIFAGAAHTNNISKVLTTYTNSFEIVTTQGKTIFEDTSFSEWEKNNDHLYYQHPYWKERSVNLDVFDWPTSTFGITTCLNDDYFKTENQSNKRKHEDDPNNPRNKQQRLE